jgi:hypothetical protein
MSDFIYLGNSIFLSHPKTDNFRAAHSDVSILLKYPLKTSIDSKYIDFKKFGGSPTYPKFAHHSEEGK